MLDTYYPKKTICLSNCDPPFVTPEIKLLLREKNDLMKRGKIEHAGALALKIGNSIAKFNSTRLSHINHTTGTKDLWTEVRRLLKPASSRAPFPDNFSAELLNCHFATISTDSAYKTPPKQIVGLSQSDIKFSELNVFNMLDNLKHSSPGIDGIPVWFLRTGAPLFSEPLTYLFNLSVSTSTVPEQWKVAIIHPIPKITSPQTPSDMRPI